MKSYYLTFGQKSPFRDGYVLIVAEDYKTAREEAGYVFGDKFSMLYQQQDFNASYFPDGQIGKTLNPTKTT